MQETNSEELSTSKNTPRENGVARLRRERSPETIAPASLADPPDGPTISLKPSRQVGHATNQKASYEDTPDDLLQTEFENAPGESNVRIEGTASKHGTLFYGDEEKVLGNQCAFAEALRIEEYVTYDLEWKTFRRYDSQTGVWTATTSAKIKRLASEFIHKKAAENSAEAFLPRLTVSFINGILDLLKGYEFAEEEPSSDDATLHIANGMLTIGAPAPQLRPFAPAHWSRWRIEVRYSHSARCPRFIEQLLAPALPTEDIGLLQRYCGSLLLRVNRAQRFLSLYGAAGSGKSTFVTVLEMIFGPDHVGYLRTKYLNTRFETHSFRGKLLLTAKDIPSDFLRESGALMLKSLTGGDLIETELKYGGKFKLTGSLNVILTGNTPPQISFDGDQNAWHRRLLPIEFEGGSNSNRVANLAQVLVREEAEGILNWMVQGAMAHVDELDQTGDYVLSQRQITRIDSIIQGSSSAEFFIKNHVEPHQGSDLSVEELTQAYFALCNQNEWVPLTQRQFANTLPDLMQRHSRAVRRNDVRRGNTSVRGYKHVKLVEEQ